MRKFTALGLLVGLAASLVPMALGAGGTTAIRLSEFKLVAKPAIAKAGKVTFVVKNAGKLEHEMVVMKTNVPAGKLPLNAKNRVPEKGVVGEAGDIKPGQTKRVTLTLKAGKYVLLCNLAGHYKQGQYSAFTVK